MLSSLLVEPHFIFWLNSPRYTVPARKMQEVGAWRFVIFNVSNYIRNYSFSVLLFRSKNWRSSYCNHEKESNVLSLGGWKGGDVLGAIIILSIWKEKNHYIVVEFLPDTAERKSWLILIHELGGMEGWDLGELRVRGVQKSHCLLQISTDLELGNYDK